MEINVGTIVGGLLVTLEKNISNIERTATIYGHFILAAGPKTLVRTFGFNFSLSRRLERKAGKGARG